MKIYSVFNPSNVIYEDGSLTMRETVENAVRARADLAGADLTGAYLKGADLTRANLKGAYLACAYLTGADLTRAYLKGADLAGANLTGANLTRAYLACANLTGADLTGANLTRADLTRADLKGAYLACAYLKGADLTRADLAGADLTGADLTGAKNAELAIARTRILPKGALIAYKKCQSGVIVKLRIPEEARRSHAFGRKCRAEFVDVLEVIGGEEGLSVHDLGRTVYRVGERVHADSWCEDFTQECASGIHFFITREEAEAY